MATIVAMAKILIAGIGETATFMYLKSFKKVIVVMGFVAKARLPLLSI